MTHAENRRSAVRMIRGVHYALTVILTEAEKNALDLEDVSIGDIAADDTSEEPDGSDGPKRPTGRGGPK